MQSKFERGKVVLNQKLAAEIYEVKLTLWAPESFQYCLAGSHLQFRPLLYSALYTEYSTCFIGTIPKILQYYYSTCYIVHGIVHNIMYNTVYYIVHNIITI